jgi:hypothetical protein
MTGGYERLSGPPAAEDHSCHPPGWWRRWRDGVRPGAVWRCECGLRYEFRPERIVTPHIGRPGQKHAPWWLIYDEMSPPPPRKPVMGI